MLLKSKAFLYRITSLYTLIFIVFIAIPAYFYTQLEIEHHKTKQNRLLYEHLLLVENALYAFSSSKNDTFIFPKSFQYEVRILNQENQTIFKTINPQDFFVQEKIEAKKTLQDNRLHAQTLVVSKQLSFLNIYLKILILSISISFFIFIFIYLLIKSSVEPFKKANEYLDAFFNDAMHELKTPLGIIQLNLEILEEKHPRAKELARSINATKNLFLIYEDIEYLIKQKSVNYSKEVLDFSYILSQRIDQFESLTQTKNLNFIPHIPNNIMININRTHLQRIIDNTLSNALKYSYKNSAIDIVLTQNESWIKLHIHNFGEPICDKNQIFNRYYKENSIKGGFGIGLNIVKNICDENKITIKVESSVEEGTTFCYTFLKIT